MNRWKIWPTAAEDEVRRMKNETFLEALFLQGLQCHISVSDVCQNGSKIIKSLKSRALNYFINWLWCKIAEHTRQETLQSDAQFIIFNTLAMLQKRKGAKVKNTADNELLFSIVVFRNTTTSIAGITGYTDMNSPAPPCPPKHTCDYLPKQKLLLLHSLKAVLKLFSVIILRIWWRNTK